MSCRATFQKVLTDKHAASVRHAEGGAFQILRVFQIHDHAAPAHKKRVSSLVGR